MLSFHVFSILSYLNPLNWGKDLTKSFIGNLESGLLYLFSTFINDILSLVNSVLGLLMGGINSIIGTIAYASSLLGPFSLPVFFILLLIIFIALYLIIGAIKNVPVVGDLV